MTPTAYCISSGCGAVVTFSTNDGRAVESCPRCHYEGIPRQSAPVLAPSARGDALSREARKLRNAQKRTRDHELKAGRPAMTPLESGALGGRRKFFKGKAS